MNNDKDRAVFSLMYQDIEADGIQRSDANKTGKGYNTTGYGYQWIVDDLNQKFGFGWSLKWKILHVREGKFSNGRDFFEVTVETELYLTPEEGRTFMRSNAGGNISGMYSDALKGAIGNGLKKTAAMFGIGSNAFRGEIDEENREDSGPAATGEAKSYSGGGAGRLDFNDVVADLKKLTKVEMKPYYEALVKNFPKLSDAQRNALTKIFEKAYNEAPDCDTGPKEPAVQAVEAFFGGKIMP